MSTTAKTVHWRGLALAILFAATVAFVGGAQAIHPETASALKAECNYDDEPCTDDTDSGGGESGGSGNGGGGGDSGGGIPDDGCYGWCSGGDQGSGGSGGSGDGCYGHCWDPGGIPDESGEGTVPGSVTPPFDPGSVTPPGPSCEPWEQCGDPCSDYGECDGGNGGQPGGLPVPSPFPSPLPPDPCGSLFDAYMEVSTRGGETAEEVRAAMAYLRCMEDIHRRTLLKRHQRTKQASRARKHRSKRRAGSKAHH